MYRLYGHVAYSTTAVQLENNLGACIRTLDLLFYIPLVWIIGMFTLNLTLVHRTKAVYQTKGFQAHETKAE